jgi:hypothetical protein
MARSQLKRSKRQTHRNLSKLCLPNKLSPFLEQPAAADPHVSPPPSALATTAQLVLLPISHHAHILTLEPVARTPSKLTSILIDTYKISTSELGHLTIVSGNAKSPSDVTNILFHPSHPDRLVDTIFFGVGAYVIPQFSLLRPLVLPPADQTITEDCMRALFDAIDSLSPTLAKPFLVVVSATAGRDVWHSVPWPWMFAPLYKWLLCFPQADKLAMESLVYSDDGNHIQDYVVIRPAILTDGERGIEKVRHGWVWATETDERRKKEVETLGPAVGWCVGRRDVGRWVFEKVVKVGGRELEGKSVSLCY